ncbi:MAG: hypothetical protein HY551_05930 [Elusimicrobia bacterium]|nr:hypothetical protein [Elusimicrobiota bacterium]
MEDKNKKEKGKPIDSEKGRKAYKAPKLLAFGLLSMAAFPGGAMAQSWWGWW